MRVINLASGSDGNLTYIETESSKILLDDGLSCKETIKRLDLLKVSPEQIDAILVTHQHVDHIRGVDSLSSKYDIPVFAHQEVWGGLDGKLSKVSVKDRKAFDGKFEFKDLTITPIEVSHDVKCYAFSIENGGSKISVVTDLGHITDRVIEQIAGSSLVYIEANYDKNMLIQGQNYPLSLKRRIAGPNGHLSNDDSERAIEKLAALGTRQFVLSHLSKENNTPNLAFQYITERLAKSGIEEGVDIKIDVASPNPGVIFKLK